MTAIKEEIVFLFVPFRKNKIMVLIMIQITKVGINGLNPHPTIITNKKIRAKFM